MWRITREPKGKIYTDLLHLALTRCTLFSFRRNIGCSLGEIERRIEDLLAQYRVEDEETHQKWDVIRTEFFAGLKNVAIMQTYKFTAEAFKILANVDGLYSWQNPEMPEDLCFHVANGKLWLNSDACGKKSWIDDTEISLEQILLRVPNLQVEEW